MKTTIIIPTYNRLQTLKKCLSSISKQIDNTSNIEVLIIDDGSNDGTFNLGSKLLEENKLVGKFLHQNQSGPSKARNLGIRASSGDIIIFIGDDILISPNFILKHIELHHQQDNIAVIGKTLWDPDLNVTDFMKALENGIQFDFNNLNNNNVSYKHCYTSNISVSKHFILKNKIFFDEDFSCAAFEDIEWGYRLFKAGMQFVYESKALAYHHHMVDLKTYSRRMILAGKSFNQLLKKHPLIEIQSDKKNYLQYLELKIRAKFREFFLNTPNLSFLIKNVNKEKWIKTILGYYQEKGIRES